MALTIIKKKSDVIHQASLITLCIQSSLSRAANISITQSDQRLSGPLPGDTGPSCPNTNQPAFLPCLQTQGSAPREACCPPPIGDAILAFGDLHTLLKSRNTAIFSDHVLRTMRNRTVALQIRTANRPFGLLGHWILTLV